MAAKISEDPLWPAFKFAGIIGAFIAFGILGTILALIGVVHSNRSLVMLTCVLLICLSGYVEVKTLCAIVRQISLRKPPR